jgi:hypothetical protein
LAGNGASGCHGLSWFVHSLDTDELAFALRVVSDSPQALGMDAGGRATIASGNATSKVDMSKFKPILITALIAIVAIEVYMRFIKPKIFPAAP